MLDNYMDLVTAVELGCMPVISPGHISQYDFYMQCYLENFKDLYKTFMTGSEPPHLSPPWRILVLFRSCSCLEGFHI